MKATEQILAYLDVPTLRELAAILEGARPGDGRPAIIDVRRRREVGRDTAAWRQAHRRILDPQPAGRDGMTGEAFYDPDDGADLLDDVEAFLARFVVYPSDHETIAHTLWIAHAHLMDGWESTPRIVFLSPEPNSGKTRALEVTEPLVPRPVHAINTTPSYLFRKVSDVEGPPTILYDEIDTVFGPKAKDNEDMRGRSNAGHRKGASPAGAW